MIKKLMVSKYSNTEYFNSLVDENEPFTYTDENGHLIVIQEKNLKAKGAITITFDDVVDNQKNLLSNDDFNNFLSRNNLVENTHPILNGKYKYLNYYKLIKLKDVTNNVKRLKSGGNPLDENDYEIITETTDNGYQVFIPELSDIENDEVFK